MAALPISALPDTPVVVRTLVRALRVVCAAGLASLACAVAAGCCEVTVYQPLRGLQRPAVIDTSAENFTGSRIFLRCLTSNDLPPDDANKVCQNLATTFRKQGAEVEATVPRDRDSYLTSFAGEAPDLTIEIASKLEHSAENQMLSVLSGVTLTLIPAVAEQTFSQNVVIRGKDRSILVADSLRARFVTYTGVAVWSINWLLDWVVRSDDDDMSGDAPNKDFSRDFYTQVSQLAFNARVRSDLLGLTPLPARPAPVVPRAEAAPPAAAPPTDAVPANASSAAPVDAAAASSPSAPAAPPPAAPEPAPPVVQPPPAAPGPVVDPAEEQTGPSTAGT